MIFVTRYTDQQFLRPSKHLAKIAKGHAEAVVQNNRLYLRTHHVPPLYQSGVVYQEEPPGQGFEEFAPICTVILRGWGDCDDLVPWRVAELQEAGEPAQIRLQWVQAKHGRYAGKKIFHLTVRRFRRDPETNQWVPGAEECPSTRLGMK